MPDAALAPENISHQRLSQQQLAAANKICRLIEAGAGSVTFGGLAGTGKTTVVGHLHEVFGLQPEQIGYCAFTGKAASVVNKKFPKAQATTIHGLIYRAIERHCKDCPARFRQDEDKPGAAMRFCHSADCPECRINFVLREKLPREVKLIVCDEASMVPGVLYDHLQTYGVPIVWVGDHGQLPPVKSAYNVVEDPDVRLEKIHRHAADSPILQLAMWVRNSQAIPKVGRKWGDGVEIRRGGYFRSNAEEWLNGELIAVCATNAQRMAVNRAARRAQGFDPDQPEVGDRVVCLRNNVQAGVFNGLTGTVREINPSVYDQGYYVSIDLDNEDRVYTGLVSADQFDEARTLYELPKEMGLWTYGYGLTVHKCVDDRTKILTQRGWKRHDQLRKGDKVLTLNPDTQLSEWQAVQGIYRHNVRSEPMLSIEAESHSSLTTLNHRWPTKEKIGHSKGGTTWRTSGHLYHHPSCSRGIFKAAPHAEHHKAPKYSDAFVELVAWFWTEGSIQGDGKGGKIGAVRIFQSLTANPKGVKAIRRALQAEFGPPRKLGRWTSKEAGWSEATRTMTQTPRRENYTYQRRTFNYVTFTLNNAAGYRLQVCAPNKNLSPKFLLALTKTQLELFIKRSIEGDGSAKDGYLKIRQGSRKRLEAFQFACTLAGYSTAVIRRSGNTWYFRLKTGQILRPRKEHWKESLDIVPYTGVVWCPQTPNGTWFAKRNETTYFTGNSQGSEYKRVVVVADFAKTSNKIRWLYTAITRATERLEIIYPG